MVHVKPGELLENFGKTELGESIDKLTLNELANFNFAERLRAWFSQV
jgi:hypothetical protein